MHPTSLCIYFPGNWQFLLRYKLFQHQRNENSKQGLLCMFITSNESCNTGHTSTLSWHLSCYIAFFVKVLIKMKLKISHKPYFCWCLSKCILQWVASKDNANPCEYIHFVGNTTTFTFRKTSGKRKLFLIWTTVWSKSSIYQCSGLIIPSVQAPRL